MKRCIFTTLLFFASSLSFANEKAPNTIIIPMNSVCKNINDKLTCMKVANTSKINKAESSIYKYKDKNGQVHYSNSIPSQANFSLIDKHSRDIPFSVIYSN